MIFRVSILLQRFPRGINVFRTSIRRSKSIISAQFIDLEKLWSLIKLAYRLSYTHLSWILVIDDSMAAIDHQLSKRVTIVKLARSSVPYFHALYKYHLTSALTLRHLPSYLTVSSSWRNFSTGRRRSPFNSRERERETLIRPWNFHVHGMKQLRKVFIVWRTSGCPRKKVACHEPIPSTSDVPNTSHVPRNRG